MNKNKEIKDQVKIKLKNWIKERKKKWNIPQTVNWEK